MGDSFGRVDGTFLDGFSRVPRVPQGNMLTEAERQRWQRHQARVATAAEFLRDLNAGAIRAYYLREVLRPSSPEMVRLIEANYPGLFRQASPDQLDYFHTVFEETHTTSDFPLLMGDVLDRELIRRFNDRPGAWRQYLDVGRPLRDFRTTRMITTDGGDGRWDAIPEEATIEYTSLTETEYTMTPQLYGKAVKLSWRLMFGDDLGAFLDVPAVLARGGRRTIDFFGTDLLFDASGPDATFFSAGNGNLLTGNPAFDIGSLGTAVETLMGFTDSEGEPISVDGMRLVYPPALHVDVNNVLNQLSVDVADAGPGGAAGQTVRTNNWLVRGLTPVMDPYIPIVASTANGNTSWVLIADPASSRPAARVRFITGFETPQLYRKASNTAALGGGIVDNLGDFNTMSTEFKGLIGFAGAVIEPKAAVASNGSNS